MTHSTPTPDPFATLAHDLATLLRHHLQQLLQCLDSFRRQSPTPTATHHFENDLAGLLRELGRMLVEWTFNHLEPDDPAALPTQLLWEHQAYQRKRKSPRRALDGLFGPIRLKRQRYEPIDGGEHSIFPLEIALGIEAQRATPALAERVGHAAASLTQSSVRELLVQQHDVKWSVKTLRTVTASLSAGMSEHRETAQVAKLVEALHQAAQSTGPHPPTVSVGRDGVMVPVRGKQAYSEASTATVAVQDRSGQRICTVYLGRMPEPEQPTLSGQLTSLLLMLMTTGSGPLPRWQYLTDGGHLQGDYFRRVLRWMKHPVTGVRLCWEWTIDFFHACEYLTKLGQALYGRKRRGWCWSAKMRRWLRRKAGGIQRVLYSAAAVRSRRKLSATAEQEYEKAWKYLQKRKRRMDYAGCKADGLAIGSGVTEAACKTVFTQRVKQSGMRWGIEGGQVIVDLRILVLSGVWKETYRAYLASKSQLAIGPLWEAGNEMPQQAA